MVDTVSKVTNTIKEPIYVNIDWGMFDKLISKFVSDNEDIKTKFDYIYAIPRGGLVIGTILSYLTNTPLLTNEKQLRKINHKSVLIVDDILDSGNTVLSLICGTQLNMYNVSIMSLVYKSKTSRVKPDYYCMLADEDLSYSEYSRLWFNFPWDNLNKES